MNHLTEMEIAWQCQAVVSMEFKRYCSLSTGEEEDTQTVSGMPWGEPEGSTGVTQSTVRTFHHSIRTPKPNVVVYRHKRRSMVRSDRIGHMPTYLLIEKTLVLTSELFFTSNSYFKPALQLVP